MLLVTASVSTSIFPQSPSTLNEKLTLPVFGVWSQLPGEQSSGLVQAFPGLGPPVHAIELKVKPIVFAAPASDSVGTRAKRATRKSGVRNLLIVSLPGTRTCEGTFS